MDNFDNFFNNDNGENQNNKTPIYHTPDNNNNKQPKANSIAIIISSVVTVVVCLILIINVVVLATLKDDIATKYADKLYNDMENAYKDAIEDSLNDKDIVDDIINSATDDVLDQLNNSMGEIAKRYEQSVAAITAKNSKYISNSTGFIITDSTSTSTTRYFVTNAHCVAYEAASLLGGYILQPYDQITCKFKNDETTYKLEVVSYGEYYGDHYVPTKGLPDLAICKFVDKIPSNEQHPSLKIRVSTKADESDIIYSGKDVAVIGNPGGIGISIATGVVALEAKEIPSFGSGKFIMTTAAVNPGNSGGPMIDKTGSVIGVVESKIVDEEIESMGFALSTKTLVNFIKFTEDTKGVKINYITY